MEWPQYRRHGKAGHARRRLGESGGQWFQGEDAFAKSLESLHSGKVKESVWQTGQVRVRFLSPSIAVVHVYFSTSSERNPDGSARPPRRGIFTRIEEKRRGKWVIVASQATSIVPPETATAPAGTNTRAGQ